MFTSCIAFPWKSTHSKKIKIEILGITVNHVVTIVGTPSYTSGAQLWKGAAATLNNKPTPIINIPKTIPCVMLSDPETLAIVEILSKLVSPVYEQIILDPSKISAEDKAPSRKYLSPADVADSEFRQIAARIQTAKLCNSIDKYIETKSALEIKKEAPIVVNNTIKGYSATLGPSPFCQGSRMKAPTVNRKTSINCVTVVTWNKPLYNPRPEPIAWMYSPLKDSAAAKSKIIAVIRVNNVGDKDDE